MASAHPSGGPRLLTVVAALAAVLLGLVGLGPAAQARATVARTLTVRAAAATLAPGASETFTGVLSRSPKGSLVRLQRRSGTSWVTVRSTRTTTASGAWSAVLAMPAAAGAYSFRATAPATARLRAATSRTMPVTALTPVTVTLQGPSGTVPDGNLATLSGTVSPFVKDTTVTIQYRDGTWQTATTATVGSSGAFSAYVLPIGPSDRYRAIVPRVGLRAAAVSPVVTVTSTAAPTILTTVLPYAQVNAGYQAQLKISGGGPGTWSAVGLPAGLNLNASTGQISGTPQATGTTTFNVEFTPTSVASVDAQVSIVVGTRAAAPVQAVAGGKSSCRISADTTLWCWGYDESGELGDGGPLAVDPPGVLAPVQIVNKLWTQLTIGGSSLPNHSHACALRESQGFGQCWGGDEDGELGIGGGNSMTAPTTIAGGHLWNELSAGWTNTCGVTTGGALYCWGDDAFGQSATRVNTNVPTRVGTSTAWDQVSSGSTSSCGIRTAGSLWCWGMDARGQLGTGSRTDTDVPTRVGTATSWSQVSVGDGYACAVRTDGTVWCWGSSTSGQLGNGVDVNDPTKDVLAPRQVGAGTNWAQVSAGGGHTCAVTTAGTAWCWGQNSNGELGDGSISPDVTSPVQVGTGADWTSISGGYDDTCGVEAGLVECWGSNEKGKLGIDADPSSTPRVDVPTEVAN